MKVATVGCTVSMYETLEEWGFELIKMACPNNKNFVEEIVASGAEVVILGKLAWLEPIVANALENTGKDVIYADFSWNSFPLKNFEQYCVRHDCNSKEQVVNRILYGPNNKR